MIPKIKRIIKSIPNIHRPGDSPNVFLFSVPRGGSTWLMELICSQPGFKYCDEPLNLRNPAVCKHLGIGKWQELYRQDADVALHNYFQLFHNGQLHHNNSNVFRGQYRLITHRIVFKIIHGGEDRINWFRDNFNGRIVFLLRHPIAVSLSRKELPRLRAFLHSDYRRNYSTEQLDYAKHILDSGSKLQQGVLSWCLQNAVPLWKATDDWTIVTYEQLVLDPHPIIEYLVDKLELPEPWRMVKRLNIPSGSTVQSAKETQRLLDRGEANERSWLVEKWRKKIDKSEEYSAMEILERFHLDVYRFGDALPVDRLWLNSRKPLTPFRAERAIE